MINERRSSDGKDEKRDLLSNFIDANEEFLNDGERRLADEELIGTFGDQCGSGLFEDFHFRKHFHVLPCGARGKITSINKMAPQSEAKQTSGHTLCFALSMLALHQEEQEALYRHIQDILPDGRLPVSVQVFCNTRCSR